MKQIYYILVLIVFVSCGNTETKGDIQKEDILTYHVKLSRPDSLKLANFQQIASENKLAEKSIPEIQMVVADWFLGTPYVGGTLDINKDEQLIVNLQGLDCVTFVENVSAMGMCIKSNKFSNEKYFEKLRTIRYRDGKINGYVSRLHYFTDWLLNNQSKGLISIVSNDFGDADFNASVSFMSQNPQYYKPLSDSIVLAEIKDTEKRVSAANLKMVSEEHLENVENLIKEGDIIAIATTIKGIDIAHTGIAKHLNGRLHFIHASSAKGKVVISEKPLSEYLKSIKTDTGVLIARINQQ